MAQPDVAYFGQKDAQQAAVIRRLVADLDIPVRIATCPTVREPDGLALSSRNVFLSPEARTEALALSGALRAAVGAWRSGERSADGIERAARAVFDRHPRIAPDYVAVVDPARFEPVDPVDDSTIVAVAARVGQTRLIDNVRLGAGLE
jgi:pantoate--beta-alanine ligase